MEKSTRNKPVKQCLRVTAGDFVFVGLDVHKRSAHMAIRVNGQFRKALVGPMDPEGVGDWLESLRPGLKQVVYEAGPTGYGLVRALRQRGFPAQVIDPTKMPRTAGQSSKSDGLDCRLLAKLAEKGVLPFVAVPSQEQEAQRQILRSRETVIKNIRQVKCRIKSFLLLYGIDQPTGLAHWSKGAVKELKDLKLSADLRFSLVLLLQELGFLEQQKKRVTRRIEQIRRRPDRREDVDRLCNHPGVGTLTAMLFLSELFQPERFETKEQVACFLGLAPRVRQSGETRREGPTIRAGQGTLRSKLVEASWSWIRHDQAAGKIYSRLCRNTGSGKKAIVGMARRMAVNLWAMTIKNETYRPAA